MRVIDEAGARAKLERVKSQTQREQEELISGLEKPSLEKLAQEGTSLIVSAPGKVILFGEHAVVHGVVRLFSSSHFPEAKAHAVTDFLDRYCWCDRSSMLLSI